MEVTFHICLLLLPFLSYGDPVIRYFPFDGVEMNDDDPFKNSDDLHVRSWKNADDPKNMVVSIDEDTKYGVLSPNLRQNRDELDAVKTISFPALFTPRFGRKRYTLQPINNSEMNYGKSYVIAGNSTPKLGISKHTAGIYLNSRNAIEPRLAMFKSYNNKKNIRSRNDFTPRLGRSSSQNLVQLSAGSAFTPRLGRSSSYKQIRLNAGRGYSPRLSRSENQNQIHLNAGNAFTPRLGRSENQNQIHLNAGSAFTPRLGRSENQNQIHLNAGSAFTPRFGRSKDKLEQRNAEEDRLEGFQKDGNAFPLTLQTIEDPDMIS